MDIQNAITSLELQLRSDDVDEKTHCERAANELVAFAAAGFRAG